MSGMRSQHLKLGHSACEDAHEPENFLEPPTDTPDELATDAGEETQSLDQPIGASSLQGLSNFSSLGTVGQQHGFWDLSKLPVDPTAARPLQVDSAQNVDQGKLLSPQGLIVSNTLNFGRCVFEAKTLLTTPEFSRAIYVYNRGPGLYVYLAFFIHAYFQFPCTLNMNGFTPWIESFASHTRLVLDLFALVPPSATVSLAAEVTEPLTVTVKNGGWPDRTLQFTAPNIYLGYSFQMNRPAEVPAFFDGQTSYSGGGDGDGGGVADGKEGIPARTSATHPSQPFVGATHVANNCLQVFSLGSSSLPFWQSSQITTLQPLTSRPAPTPSLEPSHFSPLPSSVSSMRSLSPMRSMSSMSSSSSSSIPTAPQSPLSKLQSFSSKAAALLSPSSLEPFLRWPTVGMSSSLYYPISSLSGPSSVSTNAVPAPVMPPSLPKPVPGPPSKKRKGADKSNKGRTKNATKDATKTMKGKGRAAVAFLKPLIAAFEPQPAVNRPRTYDVATSHMAEDVPGGGYRCTFVFQDGRSCSQVFTRRNNCVTHYKKHARPDSRPFKCSEGDCTKVYADQSSLDRHRKDKHQ